VVLHLLMKLAENRVDDVIDAEPNSSNPQYAHGVPGDHGFYFKYYLEKSQTSCVPKNSFLYLRKISNVGGVLKILFADRELELCAVNESVALKTMGKVRAKLYVRRLKSMKYAPNFEDLRKEPGNFHELVGNRKGQWACNLDQPYRLVSKGAEPNETDLWKNVSEATILEIVDYH